MQRNGAAFALVVAVASDPARVKIVVASVMQPMAE
jgi:hypothetical protein